jgi:hypothetical protein
LLTRVMDRPALRVGHNRPDFGCVKGRGADGNERGRIS